MQLEIRPLHPVFTAEVIGLDLTQGTDPELAQKIHAAMDQYSVLVFKNQHLSDDQQMAFARSLGTLESTPAQVSIDKQRLKHREMVDISNLDESGALLDANDRRRLFNLGNMLWHTDSSFKPTPALYSMLHARAIPPEGGNTEFADMRDAWDTLDPAIQHRIEHSVCDHSLIYSRALLGFDAFTPEEQQTFAPVPQRLVRKHPGSGRRSLFLASHIGAVHGMPRPEALMLIRDLMEHAVQKERVYAHPWQVNDLVIWDNRCTMHRGRAYDDQRYKRDMRRLTLEDCAPTLLQPA